MIAQNVVAQLDLPVEPLSNPYALRWIKDDERVNVTGRCSVIFSIGAGLTGSVWCDIVDVHNVQLLPGCPLLFARNVMG